MDRQALTALVRSWGNRLLLGALAAVLSELLAKATIQTPVISQVDTQAAGLAATGALFGPAGILGGLAALAVSGGLQRPLQDAVAYTVCGAVGYAAFRWIPGIGRGLPNIRSYLTLLAVALAGGPLRALVAALGRFDSAYWLAVWIWSASSVTSLLILLPPVLVFADRYLKRWLSPIPGEVVARPGRGRRLVRRRDDEGPVHTSVVLRRSPPVQWSVLLIGIAAVGITLLLVPASQLAPWSRSWLGLLYVVPVLWAAVHHGLRGGVLAASGMGVAFLLASAFLGPVSPGLVAHQANLMAFSFLLLLSLIGALSGASQDREVELKQELLDSEERFRLLCDAAFEGIGVSEKGKVLEANHQLAEMLCVTHGDLIGSDVAEMVAPESRTLVKEKMGQNVEGPYEHLARRKDGSLFPVEVHARSVPYRGRRVRVTAIRDISAWKEAQAALAESQEQLRQAQRLEAIGQLAGGVAHDFNNLLTVITGYIQIILNKLSPTDSLRQAADEISKAADRATSLVRQLLAFSRKQVLAPEVLDLNAVVTETETMLQRLIGADIELVTVLEPDLGQVEIDPGQLEQIILNIAVNARDAMPGGGRLTIETWNAELDGEAARSVGSIDAGAYVGLTISDSGTGMDAETQARIFEPFFTTKEKGRGTGLGLSTVYGTVTQSGGAITVSSKPGRGATFRIYFPRYAGEAKAQEPAVTRAPPVQESKILLLVEDEDGIRSLACKILEGRGYRVLVAGSGAEALRLCDGYAGPVDLLITDLMLPGMSGQTLARSILDRYPEMQVLYVSGYADDVIAPQGDVGPRADLLQKPFTAEALTRKVREALGPPAAS